MAIALMPSGHNVTASAGPLALSSARISIEGTSNIHAFTASTSTLYVTALEIAGTASADILDQVRQPGALKAFAVSIPAAGLTSAKGDIDKNMHKALKVQEHRDIRFRLGTLEGTDTAYRARGWLTIAGVEKEVSLDLRMERTGTALAVSGTTDLLMTDYGITPPKAMLGMLKTNPKVQIRIELEFVAV
jgi:polyisoprenoid-binding protein YceI